MIEKLTDLIRRTASSLPPDVEAALARAAAGAPPGSRAAFFLDAILENTRIAREQSSPLCQDTGAPAFFWRVPPGTDTLALEGATREAVRVATENGWLRENTLDSLTGAPLPPDTAGGAPLCHFDQSATPPYDVRLLLKGGGSENVSRQFSLPDDALGAGRDLEGARMCILRAVHDAQGLGCPPGILGVCIGSDRGGGYLHAKKQLLRSLDDESPLPELTALERRVLGEANSLGIGPMGMGGGPALLGVKITAPPRHPASYLVTVSYMCWACRRGGVQLGI